MTETELKLLLLRYNMLSKKDDIFADMCIHDNTIAGHEREWAECIDEMTEIKNELRKHGYELVYDDYRTEGKLCYSVYKLAPIDKNSPPAL